MARAKRLSDAFAQVIGGAPPELGPGSLIGLENEYILRHRGVRIDFGPLVHHIAPSARGLHPGDRNAYWLPSGALLTADETEAELALPPIDTSAGFASRLSAVAGRERMRLEALLPVPSQLEGVSTHLSVAMPDHLVDRVADEYASRYAVPLMLILDTRESPGVLVRPRPGRIELCGEFAAGVDLRAAAVFALGTVLACAEAIGGRRRHPVPHLRLVLRQGDQRFGWYVDRRASGTDLYSEGRQARIRSAEGTSGTAQQRLEAAWAVARPHLGSRAEVADLTLVDDLVDGRRRLRIERADPPDPPSDGGRAGAVPRESASAFARALSARARPGFELAPIMLTWDLAMFVITDLGRRRKAYAAVPGRSLDRFLEVIDGGDVDEPVRRYLETAPGGRRLAQPRQATQPGLYDEIGIRAGLLPVERPVMSSRRAA